MEEKDLDLLKKLAPGDVVSISRDPIFGSGSSRPIAITGSVISIDHSKKHLIIEDPRKRGGESYVHFGVIRGGIRKLGKRTLTKSEEPTHTAFIVSR